MFGDKSIFRNFPDRHERELKALEDSFDALRKRGYAAKQEYSELRSVPKMTKLLRDALSHGLVHSDWVAMIQTVRALIDMLHIDHMNLDVNECVFSLSTVEADYQQAVQKLESVPV